MLLLATLAHEVSGAIWGAERRGVVPGGAVRLARPELGQQPGLAVVGSLRWQMADGRGVPGARNGVEGSNPTTGNRGKGEAGVGVRRPGA